MFRRSASSSNASTLSTASGAAAAVRSTAPEGQQPAAPGLSDSSDASSMGSGVVSPGNTVTASSRQRKLLQQQGSGSPSSSDSDFPQQPKLLKMTSGAAAAGPGAPYRSVVTLMPARSLRQTGSNKAAFRV